MPVPFFAAQAQAQLAAARPLENAKDELIRDTNERMVNKT
jgi:hypothetical protein